MKKFTILFTLIFFSVSLFAKKELIRVYSNMNNVTIYNNDKQIGFIDNKIYSDFLLNTGENKIEGKKFINGVEYLASKNLKIKANSNQEIYLKLKRTENSKETLKLNNLAKEALLKKDYKKAISLYEKSISLEFTDEAFYALANIVKITKPTNPQTLGEILGLTTLAFDKEDYDSVYKICMQLSNMNNYMGGSCLGNLHKIGNGTYVNYKEALHWYKKSASEGFQQATEGVSRIYQEIALKDLANSNSAINYRNLAEKAFNKKNYIEAKKLYKYASLLGDAVAQSKLANIYYDKKDYKKAFKWSYSAAKQNNSIAQVRLAGLYYYGLGVKKDKNEVLKWYKIAENNGHPYAKKLYEAASLIIKTTAQLKLATLDKNQDTPNKQKKVDIKKLLLLANEHYKNKNYKKAFDLYNKAYKLGNREAQAILGQMYYNGEGVKKDYKKAYKLISGAFSYANAKTYLGHMYENGNGVEKNDASALYWYIQSAEEGNNFSKKRIGEIVIKENRRFSYKTGESINLLKKLAKQGDKTSLKVLDKIEKQFLTLGEKAYKNKNKSKAKYWFRETVFYFDNLYAINKLSYINEQDGYLSEALKGYKKASALGDNQSKKAIKRIENKIKKDEAIYDKNLKYFYTAIANGSFILLEGILDSSSYQYIISEVNGRCKELSCKQAYLKKMLGAKSYKVTKKSFRKNYASYDIKEQKLDGNSKKVQYLINKDKVNLGKK